MFFTGKHLCQSLFFNKVSGLRPPTLLKRRLWHRCFPVNIVKFPKRPFIIEHLWWLLLDYIRLGRTSRQVNHLYHNKQRRLSWICSIFDLLYFCSLEGYISRQVKLCSRLAYFEPAIYSNALRYPAANDEGHKKYWNKSKHWCRMC